MRKQIDDLLKKDMSRKEFLATFGFGVASIFGLGTLLRLMGQGESNNQQHMSVGYGASSYGGIKK